MADPVFESLVYENAAGVQTILSDPSVTNYWELRGRSGFTAPEVELITQKYVSGRVKVVNRIVLPRTVRINMVLVGKTTAERDAAFFEMVEKLMDVSGGEVGKLYVTRSDGTTVYLNCAYSAGLNIADEYRKFHRFTLEFYADDPYFYGGQNLIELDVTSDGVATLANDLFLGAWYLGFGAIGGGDSVRNPYDETVYPVYSISGKRQSLEIVNASTGLSVEFINLNVGNADKLIIDTREMSRDAYIKHPDGTTESVLGNLVWSATDIDFPLRPGDNAITWESYGVDNPLIIEIMKPIMSA